MKKIDLHKPPEGMSLLSYGPSGSGKTRWLATWPNPVIFSNNVEKGHLTIQTMDPEDWWDQKREPEVYEIENVADMQNLLAFVEKRVKDKPGDIRTVGIDSGSFYTELYMSWLNSKNLDGYAYWGNVKSHLQALLIRLHNLPGVNVVWTFLDKTEGDEKKGNLRGGIFIPGQTADILPAACQYWLYHRSFMENDKQRFCMYTKPYGIYPARCRDGGKLPNVIENPTYRQFAELSGWIKAK